MIQQWLHRDDHDIKFNGATFEEVVEYVQSDCIVQGEEYIYFDGLGDAYHTNWKGKTDLKFRLIERKYHQYLPPFETSVLVDRDLSNIIMIRKKNPKYVVFCHEQITHDKEFVVWEM